MEIENPQRERAVAAGPDGAPTLLTKGAFATVLAVCGRLRVGETEIPLDEAQTAALEQRFQRVGQRELLGARLAAREVEREGETDRRP